MRAGAMPKRASPQQEGRPRVTGNLPPLLRVLGARHEDVAFAAGVHPATLSRVLNGRMSVTNETLQRIESAIRQVATQVSR